MTRGSLSYGEARPLLPGGFDPNTPEPGTYRLRLRRGAVFSAIRIWHGAPLDPETGEEMDRSHGWQASVNGGPVPWERVWPACAAHPIDLQEYAYLMARQAWGREHDPDGPDANPQRAVDPLTAPIPF